MDQHRIPVTVIGGFLGSGKTTLLNNLLATTTGRRIAVLVNDFGPINIDASLIAKHDGETISLTNGCICCSIGSGLDAAILDVLAIDPPPDWIVIEASGVSDPARIAEAGLADPTLRLASVVTVIDAENIENYSKDPQLTETVSRQINAADLLILNKMDLISHSQHEDVKNHLRDAYGNIPVFETSHARVPEEILIDTESRDTKRVSTHREHASSRHSHELDHAFVTYAWTGPGLFSADRLVTALKNLPREIIRMKGFVTTDYHGPAIVHFAGRRVQFQAVTKHDSPIPNQLVYIGLPGELDSEVLKEISENCLI